MLFHQDCLSNADKITSGLLATYYHYSETVVDMIICNIVNSLEYIIQPCRINILKHFLISLFISML